LVIQPNDLKERSANDNIYDPLSPQVTTCTS
jgi:hypothetical protein